MYKVTLWPIHTTILQWKHNTTFCVVVVVVVAAAAVELHVTVNYIKIWNAAHQCFNGKSMTKLAVSLHNFVKAIKNRS